MKKVFLFILLSCMLLGITNSQGFGQNATDILKEVVNALGGRKVLEGIKDTTYSGPMELIQMGLSGVVTFYHKEPNKLRQDIEVMGMQITTAFDGEIAWMINPQTGNSEEMSDQQSIDMKRQALNFGNSALTHPEKAGISYSFQGKEQVEDKNCFVLEQIFADGYKVILYIESKTYLIYKIKQPLINEMGVEFEQEVFLSDYKKVEGIMFAHTATIFQDGEEFGTMNVTAVKFNSGLEDSLFMMVE